MKCGPCMGILAFETKTNSQDPGMAGEACDRVMHQTVSMHALKASDHGLEREP